MSPVSYWRILGDEFCTLDHIDYDLVHELEQGIFQHLFYRRFYHDREIGDQYVYRIGRGLTL
jgi:hypothetical protein